MKVFLLLFAGAIPLLIATPSKFLASDPVNEETQPTDSVDLAQLRKLATEQTEALSEVATATDVPTSPLRQTSLIQDETNPSSLFRASLKTTTARNWFDEVDADWRQIRDAHEALMKLIAVYDQTFVNAAEEQEALATFRDSVTMSSPLQVMVGGGEVVRQIDLQLKRIDTQIQVKDQIQFAQSQLGQTAYSACLKTLKTLKETADDDLSPEARDQIVELERKAIFGEYWQNAQPKTEITAANLAERRKYLLDSPPAKTNGERTLLAQVNEELRADECRLKIKELNEQEFETVAAYIEKATEAATCPENRRAVNERTHQWVKQKLAMPSLPNSKPAVQETTRTDGRYMAGVFDRGSNMANYYWYWSTLKSKQDKKSSNEQPYVKTDQNKGHIVDHPQAPLPMRTVNEFDQERDRLLENLDSESAWREFREVCNQLDEELENYRERGGWKELERALGESVSTPQFDEAVEFVDQILIHWDAVNDVLTETSRN